MDEKLSSDVDCQSKYFIRYNIENERKLKMIEGRHFYELNQTTLEPLNYDIHTVRVADTALIGKTIGLRSPITCASHNGICKTCYGRALAKVNKDYNIGITAVNYLTNPLTQMLLSAKHLLSTNTDKIEWGEDFENVFITNMNTIYFNDVDAMIILNKEDFQIDDNEDIFIQKFKFIPAFEKLKRVIPYTTEMKLYINPVILDSMDPENNEFEVNSKTFPEDEHIFTFIAKNNELSKSLQQILDLIESADHLNITDMHAFANKFADLLIENKMDYINSVHMELISSVLFRDDNNKRLDFSQSVLPNYNIIRVSKAILEGPLAKSLAFERIVDQLSDVKTYEKDEPSILDYLFD